VHRAFEALAAAAPAGGRVLKHFGYRRIFYTDAKSVLAIWIAFLFLFLLFLRAGAWVGTKESELISYRGALNADDV